MDIRSTKLFDISDPRISYTKQEIEERYDFTDYSKKYNALIIYFRVGTVLSDIPFLSEILKICYSDKISLITSNFPRKSYEEKLLKTIFTNIIINDRKKRNFLGYHDFTEFNNNLILKCYDNFSYYEYWYINTLNKKKISAIDNFTIEDIESETDKLIWFREQMDFGIACDKDRPQTLIYETRENRFDDLITFVKNYIYKDERK